MRLILMSTCCWIAVYGIVLELCYRNTGRVLKSIKNVASIHLEGVEFIQVIM